MSAVIFSAPQAWGKTRNAAKLMREFGCKSVVDEWTPGHDPIKADAIHLTNAHPDSINVATTIRVVGRGWKGAHK